MTLTPLLNAPIVVQVHAVVALCLVILTLVLFSFKRGSRLHRILGWIWVIAMGCVAISSFWISTIQQFGPFSLIHLLSVFTLASLVINVHAARMHNVKAHQRGMKSLVFGALLVAGAFTIFPGRIMFDVLTGG
jgi:uncharacterized membrane protein